MFRVVVKRDDKWKGVNEGIEEEQEEELLTFIS